jgi:hypothetical protein
MPKQKLIATNIINKKVYMQEYAVGILMSPSADYHKTEKDTPSIFFLLSPLIFRLYLIIHLIQNICSNM